MIKKVKNTVSWIYAISDLKGEVNVETFSENGLQKTDQKEFTVERVITRKGDKLYVKRQGYDSSFNDWIDKKIHSINEWIFSRKQNSLGTNVKFELGFSNYAAKAKFKNAVGVYASNLLKRLI